jgi:hypothetical protein
MSPDLATTDRDVTCHPIRHDAKRRVGAVPGAPGQARRKLDVAVLRPRCPRCRRRGPSGRGRRRCRRSDTRPDCTRSASRDQRDNVIASGAMVRGHMSGGTRLRGTSPVGVTEVCRRAATSTLPAAATTSSTDRSTIAPGAAKPDRGVSPVRPNRGLPDRVCARGQHNARPRPMSRHRPVDAL